MDRDNEGINSCQALSRTMFGARNVNTNYNKHNNNKVRRDNDALVTEAEIGR